MIPIIENDFCVTLVGQQSDRAWFAAFRAGGRTRTSTSAGPWTSHTMGVWHVVEDGPSPAEDGIRRLRIRQWHVPRFAMASRAYVLA